MTEDEKKGYTLYGDYNVLVYMQLAYIEDLYNVDVYIQYVVDGVTYNLADSDMSLMDIGRAEEPIEAFMPYTGNDRIPPTIYKYGNNWLCTTCEPILEEWEGVDDAAVAQVCVDINMNDVIKERRWFLVKSATFIAGHINHQGIAAGLGCLDGCLLKFLYGHVVYLALRSNYGHTVFFKSLYCHNHPPFIVFSSIYH